MRTGRLLACASLLWGCAFAAATAGPPTGTVISASQNGRYSVRFPDYGWAFSGDAGAPLESISRARGTDAAGDYREIVFRYRRDGPREAVIRAWVDVPAVLFSVRYLAPAANADPFPTLSSYPQETTHFSYGGLFAGYGFGQWGAGSPWLFFDERGQSFIISPAANFMSASLARGPGSEIESGVAAAIETIPEGFRHDTLLVAESGINRAFETWGRLLTTLHGKERPAHDADVTLAKLGYWTDNGAAYYYRYDPALGYEGTLLAVRDEFASKGVPLGYMQLDSWFYPKGAGADWTDLSGGIYQYSGDPALFPERLSGFQRRLGLPLVTHARWIDTRSPYRKLYRISGNVSPDRRYWEEVASYLEASGAAVYEQDWLGTEARAAVNLADPDEYLGNMAQSLASRRMTIQYCMPMPKHFLQSVRYGNLTTIRASGDRFSRANWTNFLYASRLASAVGLWPFTDVFRSTETGNLLIATLSAGPLGVGDPLGAVDARSLSRAVRADGVIVKPDAPLAPLDEVYLSDARGEARPFLAATRTGFHAAYVLAFARGDEREIAFRPAALGVYGQAYVYDWFACRGRLVEPDELYTDTIAADPAYYVVVPVNGAGIAFLGDADHFVSLGRQRIAAVSTGDPLAVTVTFAAGEGTRILHGYAPAMPAVSVKEGSAGAARYDSQTGLFRVSVSPGERGAAEIELRPE